MKPELLEAIVRRQVSAARAKEHLMGLWRELVDYDEIIKARALLATAVRFDLQDDEDVADLREQTRELAGHLDSPQTEMEYILAYENANGRPLDDWAYELEGMPPRARWIPPYLIEMGATSVLEFGAAYCQISVQILRYLARIGAPLPRMVAANHDTAVFRAALAFCTQVGVPIECVPCFEPYLEDAPGGFDVVLLMDVLEHVGDPHELLRIVRSRGRKVIVTVPGSDVQTRLFNVGGPRHHVRQFTPRSFAVMLGIDEAEVATISNEPFDIGVTFAAVVDGYA